MTFVFPRDLSEPLLAKFNKRLRDRHADVEIDYIGLSDLHVLVERHPEIVSRAFERIRNDALRAAQRQIAQGGQPLDTGLDLIQRTTELSRFASEQDLNFRQQIIAGEVDSFQDPAWEQVPFMTMKATGGDQVVRVDFWPREGAEVPPATWSFTDNESGREAFERAREQLAHGEETRISDSIVVHAITTPHLLRELGSSLPPAGQGEVVLHPGSPVPLRVEIETDGGEIIASEMEVRSVLPRQPGNIDFVGIDGQLRVELELHPGEDNRTTLRMRITTSFGSSAKANAAAWRVLDAFARNQQVTLHAPGILPAEGLSETNAGLSEEEAKRARFFGQLAEDVVTIEERVGQEIPIPDQLTQENVAEVANAAQMIRSGEGRGTVNSIEFTFTPHALAQHLELLETGKYQVVRPVPVTIFGRELTIGEADMQLPPMKVAYTQPTADHPRAPLRVQVVPAVANAEITFPIAELSGPPAKNRTKAVIVVPSPGEVLKVLSGQTPAS